MTGYGVIESMLGYGQAALMLLLLACLALGVGVIAAARRRRTVQPEWARAGGVLLVAALIGLGFVLARGAG